MSIDANESESFVVNRERCPQCAASGSDRSCDNLAVYSDGHGYCFKCNYYRKGTGEQPMAQPELSENKTDFRPYKGHFADITARGIGAKAARRYGYHMGEVNGRPIEFWNIMDGGEVISQKIRSGTEKKFARRGNGRSPKLLGQDLFAEGGRRLIITEGEYDAMSVADAPRDSRSG